MQRGDCVVVPGVKPGNYPAIRTAAGRRLRHNVVCEEAHGPRPSPLHQARHLCGNSACINPAHLAWGTQADNEADKREHGTAGLGERNPNAKLTEALVHRIRTMGGLQREIVEAVGVNRSTVSRVLAGRIWCSEG